MYDDPEDDEDWYDDDDDAPDDEAARCPECGADVPIVADKCPACGYWLSEADRRAMWTGKPLWLRLTAIVVLVAFLLSILGIAAAIF